MKILGIDFTSRPSGRKPITCLHCETDSAVQRAQSLEKWQDFLSLERALEQAGPWVAGIDFPFGQARRFIETIGWPLTWSDYVAYARSLCREGFRAALTRYKDERAFGDKEHRRATDKAAGSISPQKLYGVPVGLMFFEGASRLIASGVEIPLLKKGDPERIVFETYPGILARSLIGRRSYKNDSRRKQTVDQRDARIELMRLLLERAPSLYGFAIETHLNLCDDPGADHLDALLCAVQAAWAWGRRDKGYGAPRDVDPLEGWIADPSLLAT